MYFSCNDTHLLCMQITNKLTTDKLSKGRGLLSRSFYGASCTLCNTTTAQGEGEGGKSEKGGKWRNKFSSPRQLSLLPSLLVCGWLLPSVSSAFSWLLRLVLPFPIFKLRYSSLFIYLFTLVIYLFFLFFSLFLSFSLFFSLFLSFFNFFLFTFH